MTQKTGEMEKTQVAVKKAFFTLFLAFAIFGVTGIFVVNILSGLYSFLHAEYPSIAQTIRIATVVLGLVWAVSLVFVAGALETIRHYIEQGGEKNE
jgi:type II secretory pathway component PulF